VDDDSFAGDILSRMLKAQGADAELCMTSSEAKTRLDEAEFARKRVHLALIDWELEGEATGLSVLHHIMECQKWTAGMWKVVISTQELTEREQQQCREAGVRYFWTKPATVDAREGQQGVRELLAEYRLWAAQQDVSPDL
jgi:CheY-like chemotaxis protein